MDFVESEGPRKISNNGIMTPPYQKKVSGFISPQAIRNELYISRVTHPKAEGVTESTALRRRETESLQPPGITSSGRTGSS